METSEIVLHKGGGMTLSGPDATNFFRAITVQHALKMHVATGGRLRLTRTAAPMALLKIATEYTGHPYKKGQYQEAMKDLSDWIETMRAALPRTDNRTEAEKAAAA